VIERTPSRNYLIENRRLDFLETVRKKRDSLFFPKILRNLLRTHIDKMSASRGSHYVDENTTGDANLAIIFMKVKGLTTFLEAPFDQLCTLLGQNLFSRGYPRVLDYGRPVAPRPIGTHGTIDGNRPQGRTPRAQVGARHGVPSLMPTPRGRPTLLRPVPDT